MSSRKLDGHFASNDAIISKAPPANDKIELSLAKADRSIEAAERSADLAMTANAIAVESSVNITKIQCITSGVYLISIIVAIGPLAVLMVIANGVSRLRRATTAKRLRFASPRRQTVCAAFG
ncbi:hypothetical protein SAMN06265222_11088 [Neorhodopirellula lusitana]|uniref:Uncharacterized protein n=1 Tax=Neorhodopirellula lusitana TaxID=445327 RepID=A0ABY1QC06_9BACT|nr:hypothetical protein SAMN06265222_11088 [Neorhodopirellula lusitana]